jgi:hypothetical protein
MRPFRTHSITVTAVISILCLSCAQKTSIGQQTSTEPQGSGQVPPSFKDPGILPRAPAKLVFEAKIIDWSPGGGGFMDDGRIYHGTSTIEIVNPKEWRGQTAKIIIGGSPKLWQTKGLVININDLYGSMIEYLQDKRGKADVIHFMFDSAFVIKEKVGVLTK